MTVSAAALLCVIAVCSAHSVEEISSSAISVKPRSHIYCLRKCFTKCKKLKCSVFKKCQDKCYRKCRQPTIPKPPVRPQSKGPCNKKCMLRCRMSPLMCRRRCSRQCAKKDCGFKCTKKCRRFGRLFLACKHKCMKKCTCKEKPPPKRNCLKKCNSKCKGRWFIARVGCIYRCMLVCRTVKPNPKPVCVGGCCVFKCRKSCRGIRNPIKRKKCTKKCIGYKCHRPLPPAPLKCKLNCRKMCHRRYTCPEARKLCVQVCSRKCVKKNPCPLKG